MNHNAWRRSLIAVAVTVALVPAAWSASLSLDPTLLPGGQADFVPLGRELQRLAPGREAPRLLAAPRGQGVNLPGWVRLDEPRLILADDPLRHAALAEARQVAVLGPSPAAETLSEVLQEAATRQGLRLTTVTLDAGEMPLPSRLAGLEAVLVLALPLHDDEAQRRLFRMLSEARIAALALTDAGQVERGALLSLPNALDVDTFHRQLALRLDDVLAGRAPEPMEARPTLGRAWLNLSTAAVLGWNPPFDLLSHARLVDEARAATAGDMALDQAVALALADNLGLAASRQAVEVNAFERDQAASRWRPNLYLEATGRLIDEERARAALGQSPQRRATAGAVLEQLIFSEPAMAAVAINASLHLARRQELEAETLDLALAVASDFLLLLRLDAQRQVLDADLELARAQRDHAARRQAIGAVGRGELVRFEAELAQARERLEQVAADQAQLRLALNRGLGRDAMAPLVPHPPQLDRPEWLGSDTRFLRVVESQASLVAWQEALLATALAQSHELAALGHLREAASRELESRRRALWLPELGLEARYTTEIGRGGEGDKAPWEAGGGPQLQQGVAMLEQQGVRFPETGRDEWSLGLSARLPLYAGGRRSIARDRSAAQLEQLRLEDAGARQGLETRLRAATVELAAAWRRIGLRAEAQAHADEALALAETAWRQGSLEQVALLDARTLARQAGLAAVEARWQYLQALVHLQRGLGVVPGPLDAQDRERLVGHVGVLPLTGKQESAP
ncbi:TolC family protein [Halomonas sp. E14]|uniref:TolC family protein n=1 Tax=Halomonas sp. E14 TaxID=3397245 RepID=UPI00403E8B69